LSYSPRIPIQEFWEVKHCTPWCGPE